MTKEETPTTSDTVKCAYCQTEVRRSAIERYTVKAMGRDAKAFREREKVYHELCPTCFTANEELRKLFEEISKK